MDKKKKNPRKNYHGGKGRRGNGGRAEGSMERGNDREYREARNDVSWYSRNPNLLVAAASFPYPYRPGMRIPYGTFKYGTGTINSGLPIPGAMVLHWCPSIGKSSVATDPASILGKEMYARVRQVFSGSLDADAPDFVMYVTALDSVFTYIAWLKRVFRCLNAWSPENYFTPDGMLVGMGFTLQEISDLRANKMALWQCINDLVLQSHKFTVPASMDYFNRHYWMSDNVYTDAQSMNSQFYLFSLDAVYKYGEQNMPSGDPAAGLIMTALPTIRTRAQALTYKDLYNFGLSLINALVSWDDAYTINGYLRRAFEGDAQFVVGEIESNAILTPVYEPEVLMQIENSRSVPRGDMITDYSGFNVSQDVLTNAVLSKPKYSLPVSSDQSGTLANGFYDIVPLLTIRSDAPTVADNVVASRLQAAVSVTVDNGTATIAIDAGSEIPLYWAVSSHVASTGAISYGPFFQTPGFTFKDGGTLAQMSAQLRNLMDMFRTSDFDWCPLGVVHVEVINKDGSGYSWANAVTADVHNITSISKADLANLHKVCLYSEFNSFGLV